MDNNRFAKIVTDKKFRRASKSKRKVKIDKRFQSIFKDEKFLTQNSVDEKGRPIQGARDDFKRFYDISDEGSDSDDVEKEEESKEEQKNDEESEEPKKNSAIVHKIDKKIPKAIRKKLQNLEVDYARGEANLFSDSSSSDDDESDEEVENLGIDHNWGELDNDAESTEEATTRLAACNMDWDRIRAVDLMVLFNSFLPASGAIKSVVIYPSEYGKERMKEEDVKGPLELVSHEDAEEETEEGAKYHNEKLRQYQLNRLKYYYAVVTFDSVTSADKVYTECDGLEYESSATKLDLRFIPEDMTFDDEPKEVCDKLPSKYEPRFFTNTALQQVNVDLTWDETDPERLETFQKINSGKLEDISDSELKNIVAPCSSDDDEDEEKRDSDNDGATNGESEDATIKKYRALLKEIEEQENEEKGQFEMEITWGTDLKEKTDQMVKNKIKDSEEKTPFQKMLDKKKEKRKEKRKMKKSKADDESDDIPSDIDMDNPYFAEEFDKPEFKTKKKSNKKVEDPAEKQRNDEMLLLMNDGDVQPKVKMSKKKERKLKKLEKLEENTFKIDAGDDRFAAINVNHYYNINPVQGKIEKRMANEDLDVSSKKRKKN